MAGYVLVGALAAFGLICVIWIGCGFFLPDCRGGVCVLTGPLEGKNLTTARRWIWLREIGLLYSPLLALEDGFSPEEQEWLLCHGFEICSRSAFARRLGIGEKKFDTGIGDPPGCHQCGGVSEL